MSLLNPIPIYIRKKETAAPPPQSEGLGQPIGQSFHRPERIRLSAQVIRGNTNNPQATMAGTVEHSEGYLVFLNRDLVRQGLRIERNDMLVQIGEGPNAEETEYYFTKTNGFGHYSSARGHQYLKAYFTDQRPRNR